MERLAMAAWDAKTQRSLLILECWSVGVMEQWKELIHKWGLHDTLVTRSATAFLGGMLSSYTCGVHAAGLMVLGFLIGRQDIEEGLDGVFPIAMAQPANPK
jgi:hypothetical protein